MVQATAVCSGGTVKPHQNGPRFDLQAWHIAWRGLEKNGLMHDLIDVCQPRAERLRLNRQPLPVRKQQETLSSHMLGIQEGELGA